MAPYFRKIPLPHRCTSRGELTLDQLAQALGPRSVWVGPEEKLLERRQQPSQLVFAEGREGVQQFLEHVQQTQQPRARVVHLEHVHHRRKHVSTSLWALPACVGDEVP
jgi:hypothetical protein